MSLDRHGLTYEERLDIMKDVSLHLSIKQEKTPNRSHKIMVKKKKIRQRRNTEKINEVEDSSSELDSKIEKYLSSRKKRTEKNAMSRSIEY